jgi:Holliday junction resolvase
MASDYKYGRRKEHQIGEFLERRGFTWVCAPGSRGVVDIFAKRGRQSLAIQVKATRDLSISYTRLTLDEEGKLLDYAEDSRALPTLALVTRNYVWFLSVPDGQELLKGTLKPLKYQYP